MGRVWGARLLVSVTPEFLVCLHHTISSMWWSWCCCGCPPWPTCLAVLPLDGRGAWKPKARDGTYSRRERSLHTPWWEPSSTGHRWGEVVLCSADGPLSSGPCSAQLAMKQHPLLSVVALLRSSLRLLFQRLPARPGSDFEKFVSRWLPVTSVVLW